MDIISRVSVRESLFGFILFLFFITLIYKPQTGLAQSQGESVIIETITPDSAPAGQTVEIKIEGEGFTEGTLVYLRNPVATLNLATWPVEYLNSNEINATFEIPLSDQLYGQYNFTAGNPNGPEYTLINGFTVTPPDDDAPDTPLRIDSVTPNSGRQGESIEMEIFGDGFVDGCEVKLVNENLTMRPVTRVLENSNLVKVTFHISRYSEALGIFNVTVTNPDGQEYTLEDGFTVTEGEPIPPEDYEFRIDSVSPNSGREGETLQIEIFGGGFGTRSSEITVRISRTTVISIDYISQTLIRATIWISCAPASHSNLDLTIKNKVDDREVSLRGAITAIESQEGCSELRFDSVTPRSGKQEESLWLEIVGDGFTPGTEIDAPQGIGSSVNFVDSQHLNFHITIPGNFPAPQEVYFIIKSPGEEGEQTIRFYFDVEKAATTPASVPRIPGFPNLAIALGLVIVLLLQDKFHY
jgi:hypothetical protein